MENLQSEAARLSIEWLASWAGSVINDYTGFTCVTIFFTFTELQLSELSVSDPTTSLTQQTYLDGPMIRKQRG